MAAGAERPLVVVKLGGSVITRKREVERARPKLLGRLAGEIADVRDRRIVVLHGAGSFGHPGARRFGLARPPADGESADHRARGASIVAAEVRRLHLKVLRALVDAGAAPASVPMATHARNREGTLLTLDSTPFSDTLTGGRMPVSFGDVIPDDRWGSSILSADTIAVELSRTLRPQRVVFVSDVPGVYDVGGSARGRIVPELTAASLEQLRASGRGTDVTGGIRAKVEAMLAIARAGSDAALISGLSDGILSRALRGESVHGSWARARPG
jgi:isopentenyl phosphate kinase